MSLGVANAQLERMGERKPYDVIGLIVVVVIISIGSLLLLFPTAAAPRPTRVVSCPADAPSSPLVLTVTCLRNAP